MKGVLTLIPTPIDETSPLENSALDLLKTASEQELDNSIFVIEDLKPGRRRWLRFGLTREVVNDFVLFNEHSSSKVAPELLGELQKGKNVYLMSDGGLPAFCDPGSNLVSLCHDQNIKVTATPFANSISLAVALCGFNHNKFVFEGFLPVQKEERTKGIKSVLNEKRTVILMDTPYRLKRLLEELRDNGLGKRKVFLAMDLNSENEQLLRGPVKSILSKLEDFKREFILILESV